MMMAFQDLWLTGAVFLMLFGSLLVGSQFRDLRTLLLARRRYTFPRFRSYDV